MARAWEPQEGQLPLAFEPVSRSDGTFEVTVRCTGAFVVRCRSRPETKWLRSKYLRRGPRRRGDGGDGGVLQRDVARRARQTDGRSHIGNLCEDVAVTRLRPPQQTDKQGRYRFTNLPGKVPLQLNISKRERRPAVFSLRPRSDV